MIVLIDPSYRRRDRVRRRLLVAGLITCVLAVPPVAQATTVTLEASQDAWMDQPVAHQNDNHGADTLLDVQGGNSTQVKRRALVQFDLSSIPACATVSSAVLQLRIDTAGGSSRTHGVHKVLKAWTESGVTWLKTDGTVSWSGGGANDASDSNATASATAATGTTNGATITWHVETDVGAFVASPSSNHGWLLRDETEGGSPVLVTYDSRENADGGAMPPQLVVTYTLTDANCDDANVCTTDSCTASGCAHVDNTLPCDDLLFCNGTDTCAGGSCAHSGDPCTGPDGDTDCSESCDEATDNCSGADPDGTLCRPAAGECDVADTCLNGACPADAFASDGTPCGNPSDTDCDNPDTCDGNNDCRANNEAVGFPCGDSSDTDCTNPDSCNGSGTCLANHESSGTPCSDDGEICTLDECDASGTCTHPAGHVGTECRAAADDCDVAELCDGSSTACPADAKQPDDTPCDDGLFCNGDDSCAGGSCSSHAGNVCTFVCDEPTDQCVTDACPVGPQSAGTCRTAEKSQLKIKRRSSERSILVWKFIRGESTSFSELSDPTDTADYTLCIYAGTDPALVGTIDMLRSNSAWVVLGNNKGYKYSDRTGASSGVQKVKLRASTRDRTRALIKGRGAALPTILSSTGLDMPVTAQLLNHSSGVCWEAHYTGTPKKNTATQFKAKQ